MVERAHAADFRRLRPLLQPAVVRVIGLDARLMAEKPEQNIVGGMWGCGGWLTGYEMRALYEMRQAAGRFQPRGPRARVLGGQAPTPTGTAKAVRLELWSAVLLSIWLWLAVARALLAVTLAFQDRFDSLFLTWFQIESVPLHVLNDFLLQNLALEAP